MSLEFLMTALLQQPTSWWLYYSSCNAIGSQDKKSSISADIFQEVNHVEVSFSLIILVI